MKEKEEEDGLPFFIHFSEPIAIYVIGNELIGCQEEALHEFYPERAFESLYQLYKIEQTRKQIPKRLWKYFEKVVHSKFPCIAGQLGEGRNNCLIYQMKIEPSAKKPVRIEEIAIVQNSDEGYFVNKLPMKVQLTAQEAFLVFANTCTAAAYDRLDYRYNFHKEEKFEQEKLSEVVKKNVNESENEYDLKILPIYLFSLEYIQYIREQIKKKELAPEKIFRLGGARVLIAIANEIEVKEYIHFIAKEIQENYANLTKKQKIQYYTILTIGEYYARIKIPEIEEIWEHNRERLTQMKKELKKDFPNKQVNLQKELKW